MQVTEEIREISWGSWEGTPIGPELGPLVDGWNAGSTELKAPQGESPVEAEARAVTEIKRVVSENEGKTIVFVCHGRLLRIILCSYFLQCTSRSFSQVILALPDELQNPIKLFYLVLRGLDTVEDDMTLELNVKVPILLKFYTYLEDSNWSFQNSGPNEKDAPLLKQFQVVIHQYGLLSPLYVFLFGYS